MPFSDVLNQKFIVFAGELIIFETKQKYCEVKIMRASNAPGKVNASTQGRQTMLKNAWLKPGQGVYGYCWH